MPCHICKRKIAPIDHILGYCKYCKMDFCNLHKNNHFETCLDFIKNKTSTDIKTKLNQDKTSDTKNFNKL